MESLILLILFVSIIIIIIPFVYYLYYCNNNNNNYQCIYGRRWSLSQLDNSKNDDVNITNSDTTTTARTTIIRRNNLKDGGDHHQKKRRRKKISQQIGNIQFMDVIEASEIVAGADLNNNKIGTNSEQTVVIGGSDSFPSRDSSLLNTELSESSDFSEESTNADVQVAAAKEEVKVEGALEAHEIFDDLFHIEHVDQLQLPVISITQKEEEDKTSPEHEQKVKEQKEQENDHQEDDIQHCNQYQKYYSLFSGGFDIHFNRSSNNNNNNSEYHYASALATAANYYTCFEVEEVVEEEFVAVEEEEECYCGDHVDYSEVCDGERTSGRTSSASSAGSSDNNPDINHHHHHHHHSIISNSQNCNTFDYYCSCQCLSVSDMRHQSTLNHHHQNHNSHNYNGKNENENEEGRHRRYRRNKKQGNLNGGCCQSSSCSSRSNSSISGSFSFFDKRMSSVFGKSPRVR